MVAGSLKKTCGVKLQYVTNLKSLAESPHSKSPSCLVVIGLVQVEI